MEAFKNTLRAMIFTVLKTGVKKYIVQNAIWYAQMRHEDRYTLKEFLK